MTDQLELRNKYGEPLKHDKKFRGPLWRSRSCTDVPCLLIFFIFLGGWGFIAHYAIKHGDLDKLMFPTDSYNQACGLDSGVLDKKYLFFFDLEKCIDPIVPMHGCPTPQVCVKNCPTESFFWDTMKNTASFEKLQSLLICRTDADKLSVRNKADIEKAIGEERCARWYLKSSAILNRCIWELSSNVCERIPEMFLKRTARDIRNETLPQPLAITQKRVSQPIPVKEEIIKCETRAFEHSTVIKEKVMQTNTRVAKFVGNMIAHFYNGTKNPQQLGEEIVEDIFSSWHVVLVATLCTLIASLIFISLMRWLASPILWISIFGVIIGLIVAIYYSFRRYTFWRNTATVSNHALNVDAVVQNIFQDKNTWLYLTIFLCVVFVIILLLIIVLRSRIKIAIALTKEGSKAVSSIISTVFFPIFSWLLYIAVIVYAVTIGLYLGSIGEPSFRMIRWLDPNSYTGVTNENCICTGPASNYSVGEACDPKIFQQNCRNYDTTCAQTTCSFDHINTPPLIDGFIVYNIFGYLWLSFFVAAFSDMVLAVTFATWYWTFKKSDVPYFTVGRAFRQTLFYHLGTLAFGACILAICRLIRLALEYLDRKLKLYDNAVTRAILCCMRCFFWLLENFLRFLNRNAYIMCAIHGKNFCTSAKDAFNLIMRNFLRVFTLDQVTDFLFFLSKIFLTALAGTATYFFLDYNPNVAARLHHKAVPTALVSIIAFIITSVFFGVYSMAVDTLFLCFLEDCERNDGTPQKPYFMSKNLMKILGKRNERMSRNNQ